MADEQTNIYLIGLDRDGTIIEDANYLGKDNNWKDQINFCEYALEGLKLLKQQSKFRIVVTSNQAGVARGFFSFDRMCEVDSFFIEKLKQEGIKLDGSYCCPFVNKKYADKKSIPGNNPWIIETSNRKPKIGMLEMAARNLGHNLEDFSGIYFIGDKKTDVETGLNANGKGILVYNKESSEEYKAVQQMVSTYDNRILIMKDLLEAAELIISDTEN